MSHKTFAAPQLLSSFISFLSLFSVCPQFTDRLLFFVFFSSRRRLITLTGNYFRTNWHEGHQFIDEGATQVGTLIGEYPDRDAMRALCVRTWLSELGWADYDIIVSTGALSSAFAVFDRFKIQTVNVCHFDFI
jgi:hypothetical protein